MRRLLVPLLGLGAFVALRRRLARNRLSQAPATDGHAEELRRKLEEARAAAADRDAFESGEQPVDEAEPSVAERRREVHEAARGVIETRARPDQAPPESA